jgi:hypothetical protein
MYTCKTWIVRLFYDTRWARVEHQA